MRGYRNHSCKARSCATIAMDTLDDYVEEIMIRWLSRPDVFAELTRVDDSAVAAQARADAAQGRAELAEWRQAVEKGDVTLAGYASAEKGLLARIEEAEQRAQAATMPAALLGNVGDQAEERWRSRSIEVKRQMIQAVADITLKAGLRVGIGLGQWARRTTRGRAGRLALADRTRGRTGHRRTDPAEAADAGQRRSGTH